jgi:hypothetical protein
MLLWGLGSLLGPVLALVPLLVVHPHPHADPSERAALNAWLVGGMGLGAALAQTSALGVRKLARLQWVLLSVCTALVASLGLQVTGSDEFTYPYSLVSVGLVCACGLPVLWLFCRWSACEARIRLLRGYAYASALTILLAWLGSVQWVPGALGRVVSVLGHPAGQILLRDLGFGLALWALFSRRPVTP